MLRLFYTSLASNIASIALNLLVSLMGLRTPDKDRSGRLMALKIISFLNFQRFICRSNFN